MIGQPTAQLRWVYHQISGNSGARAELRLDDIQVNIPHAAAERYAHWRAAHFPANDPRGAPGHLNRNGVANLILYAYGLAPDQPSAHWMPSIDHHHRRYTFAYEPDRPNLRWRVLGSTDLADWTQVLFDSATQPSPPIDAAGRAFIPLPEVNGRLFMRLELQSLDSP